MKNGCKEFSRVVFPIVSIVRFFFGLFCLNLIDVWGFSLCAIFFLCRFFHSIKKHFIFLKNRFLSGKVKNMDLERVFRVAFIDFPPRFSQTVIFSVSFNRHLISSLSVVFAYQKQNRNLVNKLSSNAHFIYFSHKLKGTAYMRTFIIFTFSHLFFARQRSRCEPLFSPYAWLHRYISH